jgi:hypothetical protein
MNTRTAVPMAKAKHLISAAMLEVHILEKRDATLPGDVMDLLTSALSLLEEHRT